MLTTIRATSCVLVEGSDPPTYVVQFLIDGTIETSRTLTQAQLLEAANPITTYSVAEGLALASWLGVDPAGEDLTQLTDYTVEIDFSHEPAIRRVLVQ